MLGVDLGSRTPPFEQLRHQVIEQIRSGELSVGAQLPTVRQLAGDLGLAPNTVARTYRELEAEGWVQTRGRRGTVVLGKSEVGGDALRLAETFADRMRSLGLSPSDTLRLVRTALERTT